MSKSQEELEAERVVNETRELSLDVQRLTVDVGELTDLRNVLRSRAGLLKTKATELGLNEATLASLIELIG